MLISFLKNEVVNKLKRYYRKRRAKKIDIRYVKPNYIFIDKFNCRSTIIDVGCGYEADFSLYMIEKYGLRSFGIDPTRKHAKFLEALSKEKKGKFHFFPLAVTSQDGKISFNESAENESGSILRDHINVKKDTVFSYEVESVTLSGLLLRLGLDRADYIKLDIEGAEYELIQKTDAKTLEKFNQIFIEFHHHCLDRYSEKNTKDVVKHMRKEGFKNFSFDGRNYLFYRK